MINTEFYRNQDGYLQVSKIIESDGWKAITITDTALEDFNVIACDDNWQDILVTIRNLRDVLNLILKDKNLENVPFDPVEQERIKIRRVPKQKNVRNTIPSISIP